MSVVLPDDLPVCPTHGAGSCCSAPGGADRTTTIARERATIPLLTARSEDGFVDRLLDGFGSFPGYLRRLPAINQAGVPIHHTVPTLEPLTTDDLQDLVVGGAVVVDARRIIDFDSWAALAGHEPATSA
jgi:hypothetical protein